MREILMWVAMAVLIPGLVLMLMVRRHRTEFARSLPWYSRVYWLSSLSWWCWWLEKPKVEPLLTPRGVTLSRAARTLLLIGVALYMFTFWLY